MKRIKAIGIVLFVIFMEMSIFTFITSFSQGTTSIGEIFTKELLIGNILFLIIYNPFFILFTYLIRNRNEKSGENWEKMKTVLKSIF